MNVVKLQGTIAEQMFQYAFYMALQRLSILEVVREPSVYSVTTMSPSLSKAFFVF